jgi:probable HAF family extracellular repeat protein
MPRGHRHAAALICLAMLAAPVVAHADISYTVTPIGATGSYATGMNNRGQLVGYFSPAPGVQHAFLYTGSAFLDLGTLGGDTSRAARINDAGSVVGAADTAGGKTHAFLYAGGRMTDLGTLGGNDSSAAGINGGGQIVGAADTPGGSFAFLYRPGGAMQSLGTLPEGQASSANGINDAGQVTGGSFVGPPTPPELAFHAFLYSAGSMTDLGTLGGQYSVGQAINNSGQVVGWAGTADFGVAHAFLYSAGAGMIDLGTLAGLGSSLAYSINDAGQAVGESEAAGRSSHAFLYQDGSLIDLNTLIDPAAGWTLLAATAINDQRQIAAVGCKGDLCQAVRLDLVSSVPEPQTDALLLAGLGLLGWKMRNRLRSPTA